LELLKVVILGVIISILSVLLKQVKPEYSVVTIIVGSLILIFYILNSFQGLFTNFATLIDKTGIDRELFVTMLKIIGVGYLVEFSASICNDSGNSAIANKVVLAGKILIFALSMPIISTLFNFVMDLL
jgi:stage III sporulation protein AD